MLVKVQSHKFLLQSGILLEWLPCVGCIKKKLSDSGAICVPAGVSNIPPLSKKSVIKADSCDGHYTIACQRAVAEYERGTGCLEECRAEMFRTVARTTQFCANATNCDTALAPCYSKLEIPYDVPPLTMASLPPLPKGIDVDGALPLPSVLCSTLG
jgi:hypothetical protein